MKYKNYPQNLDVAYFTLEIMLESDIPTYAGGLGVLAGDLMRSCADMEVPACCVSLVYSGSSFTQKINTDGTQDFNKTSWRKHDQLTKLSNTVSLNIMNTRVSVKVWRYDVVGINGFVVPVFLLDTDISENEDWARNITKNLYGSGEGVRILQELLLGVGGVKMLRNLGLNKIKNYHLNEGHAAFVPLQLLAENNGDLNKVKQQVVFTTHTPVPEGHDNFSYDEANHYIGSFLPNNIKELSTNESLSMTHLALNTSKYSFGVSKKHQAVSSNMFKNYNIDYITNGVHARNWVHPVKQNLYDKYLPGWETNNNLFKEAEKIDTNGLIHAHNECKQDLIDYVNERLTSISSIEEKNNPPQNQMFTIDTLTIAMARRPVAYKRPLLLYSDLERFLRIGVGRVQIIQCGKSHPSDDVSQNFVKQIISISKQLKTVLKIVYLEDYSPKIARLLVSGCDVWLNTPRRPMEASGTSGMKAALNGVLNFSVLDGWWIEGFKMVPESGFCIGPLQEDLNFNNNDEEDADSLYKRLEQEIIPMYYDHKTEWVERMKKSITLGAYFNTDRVINEYRKKAWGTN